ncbi:hypothetical protein pb186bvf_017014 [Paramecium bursaria]
MNIEPRDTVQNTIKNLQDKITNIESMLDKGSDCLIFQYGSHSIKFNKASDALPRKIRNLIGYRVQTPKKMQQNVDLSSVDDPSYILEEKLISKGSLKAQPKSMRGKPRAKIEIDLRNIKPFQNKKEINKFAINPLQQLMDDKSIVFEDDVFVYESRPDYVIKQPIKHGFFNLTNGQTINDVIDDLQKLTLYILSNKLEITLKEVQDYYCILIIPDVFQRNQIKALIDMLLRQIGFKGIYIHLESVLASFGANLLTCCVVDIGYEKINVTCVDEGIILPGTYVRKNFGSKDLDQLLMRQIIKRNAYDQSIIQVNPYIYGDLLQMEKLKEKACLLIQKEDKLNYLYELHCSRDAQEKKFLVQHNDGLYVVANSFTEQDCLNALRIKIQVDECFDFTGRLFELQYDPEDNLEELSGGVQLSWLWGSKEKELQYQQLQQLNQENDQNHQILNPNFMIPLDQMILYSIQQVQDQEMRQKLANNILFVGGGTQLQDLVDEIEGLLIERFQLFEMNEIERVEVKNIIRDVKPINIAWIGATVLPKTESITEMWISKSRWLGDFEQYKDEMEEIMNNYDGDVGNLEKKLQQYAKKDKEKDRTSEYGIKHLKEKIAFIW